MARFIGGWYNAGRSPRIDSRYEPPNVPQRLALELMTEDGMRFKTSFIDFVRANMFPPDSDGDRLFQRIVEQRRQQDLDGKFGAIDPWKVSDNVLQYEFRKLGIVFGALSTSAPCGGPADVVEVLKETYPPAEVEEILQEYFPELLASPTPLEMQSAHP
jgi:hypothetical protein